MSYQRQDEGRGGLGLKCGSSLMLTLHTDSEGRAF